MWRMLRSRSISGDRRTANSDSLAAIVTKDPGESGDALGSIVTAKEELDLFLSGNRAYLGWHSAH